MSDTHPQSTGTAGDAREGLDGRGETEGRSSESWVDRLMMAVGLKRTAAAFRESLEEVLESPDTAAEGFSAEERTLMRNILKLGDTTVEDLMVPRSEIDAIADDATLTELMIAFRESGHSRMPVYRETLDDASGMIHIRDLMSLIAGEATVPASRLETRAEEAAGIYLTQVDLGRRIAETGLVRPVLFVPASMPAGDLLARMQQNRIQMALVIDEFGGVDGLVSMEDVVETVFGDIEDEHDIDERTTPVVVADTDGWTADGRAELVDVARATGIDFDLSEESEDVDTLGGLVFALVGRVPTVGEVIEAEKLPGLAFEVLDADPRRIKRLKIRRMGDEARETVAGAA